jgi:hypothetical protein
MQEVHQHPSWFDSCTEIKQKVFRVINFYLFIYRLLLSNIISSSCYTVLNDGMISKQWIGNDTEERSYGVSSNSLQILSRLLPSEVVDCHENGQNEWSLHQGLNQGPQKRMEDWYRLGILTLNVSIQNCETHKLYSFPGLKSLVIDLRNNIHHLWLVWIVDCDLYDSAAVVS